MALEIGYMGVGPERSTGRSLDLLDRHDLPDRTLGIRYSTPRALAAKVERFPTLQSFALDIDFIPLLLSIAARASSVLHHRWAYQLQVLLPIQAVDK